METPPPQSLQLPLLPENAIAEILSWLPVKTLLRFRCVCRSWKSIISSPMFVKLHLQRSAKDANIILTSEDLNGAEAVACSVRSLLSFPPPTISEDGCYQLKDQYWVLGSCNGLVCLAGPNWWSEDRADESWFRFWNPATRITSERSPSLLCNLPRYYGFGYDSTSDTYKVVAVMVDTWAIEDSQKTRVKVYTMGNTCWRDMGSFPALPVEGKTVNENDGVYVSGTLNWLALRNFSLGYEWADVTLDRLLIVSLDMGKETYNQLLLPDGLDELPKVKPVLGVLMDCLCLCHDYKSSCFVLWQMKEFGNERSWTQLVNVQYQHLQVDCFPFEPEDHPIVPMCMSENGHVAVLLHAEDLAVHLYDCRDNRVERAKIPGEKVWTNPKDYIESLVLPL